MQDVFRYKMPYRKQCVFERVDCCDCKDVLGGVDTILQSLCRRETNCCQLLSLYLSVIVYNEMKVIQYKKVGSALTQQAIQKPDGLYALKRHWDVAKAKGDDEIWVAVLFSGEFQRM